MNALLEAGVAIYVAMAVALSVWIAIFVYLWRIDAQARELKRRIEQQEQSGTPPTSGPTATVTRLREPEREPIER